MNTKKLQFYTEFQAEQEGWCVQLRDQKVAHPKWLRVKNTDPDLANIRELPIEA